MMVKVYIFAQEYAEGTALKDRRNVEKMRFFENHPCVKELSPVRHEANGKISYMLISAKH